MKRWIATLAGAVILAATAVGPPALAQSHDHHGGSGGHSSGGGRGGPGGGGDGGGYRAPQGGHYGAPYGGGAPNNAGPRYNPGPRYGAQAGPPPGWNDQRQNGYWIGNRWHYGPPTAPGFAPPGYRPGYAPWRRGAILPPYYQNSVVDDYWDFRLRRPPYGYHWVRAGNSFLLVAVATGLIFDVVE